jgi:tetratricopeptide (TPR) repeat protein
MLDTLKIWAASACLCLALACAGPVRADWLKAESEHFIVYGNTSEASIRNYTRKVERFDSLLRIWFPPRSEGVKAPKLTIYLADGREEMRQIVPSLPANVGGFYTAGEERIFAVTGGSGTENDHILFHEYAHHFMYQYLPGSYPGWFVEGFAEFFATADLTPNRMRVGLHSPGRMNSLTMGENAWLPMETLLRSRASELGDRSHFYYAQSWALTHYFLSTNERRAAMGRYLTAVMGGGDPVASLAPATGFTPAQLQREVQTYLGRISFRPEQRESPPADVTITRLPASAPDLIWLDLRLARFVPEPLRAGNLAEARRAASRHPNDPWAARVLAQAHLDMKQPTEAIQVLEASLALQPQDPLNLRMKAVSLMDLADTLKQEDPDQHRTLFGQARSLLARAYQLDALDYRLYLSLDRSRRTSDTYPTDNDIDTLLLGRALAPQVKTLTVLAAQALISRDDPQSAISLLSPIANDPHGGEGVNEVRRILALARDKAGLPALPSEDGLAAEQASEEGNSQVIDNEGQDTRISD